MSTTKHSCKNSVIANQTVSKGVWLNGLGVNLLLCISTVVIFTGGLELLARTKYAFRSHTQNSPITYDIFDYDREKAFQLKKNYSGLFVEVPFATNSFGYRSPEIALEKPENTKRVLVLGDSISFGHKVMDNETYSYFLEETLSQNFGEDISIEIINTAAPANSPYQEYYDLERGLKFDPDAIILQLTLNDISDMPYVTVIDVQKHIDRILKERSALYLFLKDVASRIRFQDITGKNVSEKALQQEIDIARSMINDPDNPEVLKAWNMAFEWIQQMTDLAKERGIPFVLIATPIDFQLGREKQFAHPQRILQAFAVEEEIQFIDLLDILQKMYAESAVGEPVETREEIDRIIRETDMSTSDPFAEFWAIYFSDYDHPSAVGHKFISDVLQPVVLNALQ